MSFLSRLYRSRGHGIHSPLAYHLTVNVVGERGAAYYIYDELDAIPGTSGRQRRRARLLHRLAVYFRPSVILTAGSLDQAAQLALRAADSGATVADISRRPRLDSQSQAMMVIAQGCTSIPRVDGVVATVVLEPALIPAALSHLEAGIVLYDRRCALLVHRADIALQLHNINMY